jgi:hypothetical protein
LLNRSSNAFVARGIARNTRGPLDDMRELVPKEGGSARRAGIEPLAGADYVLTGGNRLGAYHPRELASKSTAMDHRSRQIRAESAFKLLSDSRIEGHACTQPVPELVSESSPALRQFDCPILGITVAHAVLHPPCSIRVAPTQRQ